MTSTDWSGPLTRQHTFTTGRTATLRVSLPMSELLRTGIWDNELAAAFDQAVNGGLADDDVELAVRLNDSIVCGLFVDPRIVPDAQADVAVGLFPISALEDSEINETISAAFGGPANDASFRGISVDAGDSEGSGDVARVASDAAGPRGGKSRGGGVGSAGGAKPRRRGSVTGG